MSRGRKWIILGVMGLSAAAGGATCVGNAALPGVNPYLIAPRLAIDGRKQAIVAEISSLGTRRAGDVLHIRLESDTARAAYVLRPDDARPDAGVIIDGGAANAEFVHAVSRDGPLYLFVDAPRFSTADVVVFFGFDNDAPRSRQAIVFEFEPAYLSDGLFDPQTNTDEDRDLLASIESVVEADVLRRLREVFDGTGIDVLSEQDARPSEFSLVTFTGRRELASGDAADSLPVTGCSETVIFGEVLPRGRYIDPGNRNRTDAAVVYVGSFRGRGDCNAGLVVNSVGNIVNALTLVGAHEAGHLVGLNHSALDGLMSPSPSLSISRQLQFERSQLVLDVGRGEEVFTSVVQDPAVYFGEVLGQ